MAVMSGPFDALAMSSGAQPAQGAAPAGSWAAQFAPGAKAAPVAVSRASSAMLSPLRSLSSAVAKAPMTVSLKPLVSPTTTIAIAAKSLAPTLGPAAGTSILLPSTSPAGSNPPVGVTPTYVPPPNQPAYAFPMDPAQYVPIAPPLPPVPSVLPSVGTDPQSFDPNVVTQSSGPVSLNVPGGSPIPSAIRASALPPEIAGLSPWVYVAGAAALLGVVAFALKK